MKSVRQRGDVLLQLLYPCSSREAGSSLTSREGGEIDAEVARRCRAAFRLGGRLFALTITVIVSVVRADDVDSAGGATAGALVSLMRGTIVEAVVFGERRRGRGTAAATGADAQRNRRHWRRAGATVVVIGGVIVFRHLQSLRVPLVGKARELVLKLLLKGKIREN